MDAHDLGFTRDRPTKASPPLQTNDEGKPLPSRHRTRRALLALAGGMAAASIARRTAASDTPSGVSGAVLLNEINAGSDTTSIDGEMPRPVFAVSNRRTRGTALSAHLGPGPVSVTRREETALLGFNNNERVKYPPAGVAGVAQGKGAIGVVAVARRGIGIQASGKIGVRGLGDVGGEFSSNSAGVALNVSGRLVSSQAGIVSVPEGAQAHDVVDEVILAPSAAILATAQGAGEVHVTSAERLHRSTFRIHLSGAAPPGGLAVAYFVLQ